MNLQVLYDVKKRLEEAAMAGTALLSEDFRLQKAADALKPLASASPVFARISAGLEALRNAPEKERSVLLLDALSLTDAVVCTQGRCGVSGDLAPLPTGGGRCLELPHGQLQPLLAALTGSGGGRLETIRAAWEAQPESFGDFRVIPALIAGLGESYAELAELNLTILKAQDRNVVPMLKAGFDPAGKKAMARRVKAISALEGPEATPWLLEMLPQSKKDVRAAVLVALGADAANVPLLLELVKKERKQNREAVLEALSNHDGPEVRDFWRAEVEKTPESVYFLRHNSADWVSDFAAAAFRALLEEALPHGEEIVNITNDGLNALTRCRLAAMGRTSPAMLDCWRWIAGQLPALRQVQRRFGMEFSTLGETLPVWLLNSLCEAGTGPLCGLSQELWEQDQTDFCWLPHALLAAFLTRPAAEIYDTFAPCFDNLHAASGAALLHVFSRLRWNQEKTRYEIEMEYAPYLSEPQAVHPLAQPLDMRWYDVLFRVRTSRVLQGRAWPGTQSAEFVLNQAVRNLFRPDFPESRTKTAEYLSYLISTGGGYVLEDVGRLQQCGWTKWKGLLNAETTTSYVAIMVLKAMPLTDLERAEELRALFDGSPYKKDNVLWPALVVQNQIAAWEAEKNGYETFRDPV